MATPTLTLAESQASRYLSTDGPCTVIRGLPEEVVAMLFAFFSRSPHKFRDTLGKMIEDGHLEPPPEPPDPTSERARKFHERMTIGYGHKSVADHAMVHWCLEGVSAISERDFLSARLLAATSKSTRFVDFRDAGFYVPDEWPAKLVTNFEEHCGLLLDAYESLIPMAESAMRSVVTYDEKAQQVWKKESGWERATSKRALDMVRDLLPGSIRTSYAVTCSATALRELLDRRQTISDHATTTEVAGLSHHIREAARTAMPTLIPEEVRFIPRHPRPTVMWVTGVTPQERTNIHPKVTIVSKPDWDSVQELTGESVPDLIRGWIQSRGHNMPPDRTSEFAMYTFKLTIPWAIQRDLGRHRMMTQTEGLVVPNKGYGCDPLLLDGKMLARYPRLGMVAQGHQQAMMKADSQLRSWSSRIDPLSLQYAAPLATMVPVRWSLNVRQLVYILGLRTVPQGHPSYRQVVQMVATAIKMADPMLAGLVDEVTNFETVLIGRPG